MFGLWLGLDWVLKSQDWLWMAKYDSPLISGVWRSCVVASFLSVEDWTSSRKVQAVWTAWYWGTWLGPRKMQAVCMKVVTGSSVAKPNCFGEPNTLTLSEQQHFVKDTACQSPIWQDLLEILGNSFLGPLVCAYGCKKKGTRKKIWWKAVLSVLDATFGCYQLDCSQTQMACWSSIVLVKSSRTVSREFYLEKRVNIGLTSYG